MLNWSPTKSQPKEACSADLLSSKVLEWVSQAEGSAFTYVQLSDLVGIQDRKNYIEELKRLDQSIDKLIRGIDEISDQRKVVVAVVGTSGVMLGEKEIHGNTGLYEELIHVPLMIRAVEGKKSIDNTQSSLVGVVKKPVRIWDLYGTVMRQLDWDVNHKVISSGELVNSSIFKFSWLQRDPHQQRGCWC